VADTIIRYSATGAQTDFTIPFDYINENDVNVSLNSVVLTKPAQWDYVNDSTVRLATACQAGDVVIVQRRTEDTDRLVDFQTGAVLTESDLDLAHKQTFYLIQEMRDALNDVAAAAIVDVTQEQLEAIGQEILSQAVADEIQGRITDIDTAGQLLLDAMMQRRLLGEPTDDYTAFVLDTNATMVSPSESLATRFETISAQYASNLAAITTEATARANADTALASLITTLTARVDDAEADIITEATARASGDSANATLITALTARVDTNEDDIADNAAAIVTEQTARANGDSANATAITALGVTVAGHTGSITTLQSVDATIIGDLAVVEANWGVSLNVNGHITGVTQNNNGDTGVFAILADEFYIVDPANGLGSPVTVFGVSGGVVSMQNAYVAGDLLVDGTITADFEFNAATIEIPTNGYIHSNTTWNGSAFVNGGWWIGTASSDPKLFFGNPSGDYIRYSAGVLTIAGGISFPGGFTSNDDAGSVIGRNDTDASSDGAGGATILHTFTVRGSGTVAIRMQATDNVYPGGGLVSLVAQGVLGIYRNGALVTSWASIGAAGEYSFTGVTVTDPSDVFWIVGVDATYHDAGTGTNFQAPVTIDWSEVRARLSHVNYS
jgi:hypothetical protein